MKYKQNLKILLGGLKSSGSRFKIIEIALSPTEPYANLITWEIMTGEAVK